MLPNEEAVGKWSTDCAGAEMLKKRLGMSFPRFWLQELELESVLKAAQIKSAMGDRHSHYGKCWKFVGSGIRRMASALSVELLIRSRCSAFVAIKS